MPPIPRILQQKRRYNVTKRASSCRDVQRHELAQRDPVIAPVPALQKHVPSTGNNLVHGASHVHPLRPSSCSHVQCRTNRPRGMEICHLDELSSHCAR